MSVLESYLTTTPKQNCIKDIMRHGQTSTGPKSSSFHVDTTPSPTITDSKSFLSNNGTKDSLTIYLAEKALQINIPMVTVTRLHVHCNQGTFQPTTGVSSHEEADTVMILHASELGAAGKAVHLMTQDTDALVLALRRLPFLGPKPSLIMGTGERRRQVLLKPIYDQLGASKAAALPGFHCITGCDTCGHIRGKSKKAAFNVFCTSPAEVTTVRLLILEQATSHLTVLYQDVKSFCVGSLVRRKTSQQHQQSLGGNDSKTNLQSKALTTFHQHLEPGTSTFSELICKLIFGTKILSSIPNFQTLVLLAGLMMQTVLLYPFSLLCYLLLQL